MKWFILTILTFVIFTMHCTEVTGPVDSAQVILPHEEKLPYYETLRDLVNIRLAGYDSLVIENKSGASLTGQLVSGIQLGRKITGRFVADQDSIPRYSTSSNAYSIRFEFPVKLKEDFEIAHHFTLRFQLRDSTQVDVDSMALMYKFPYESTEIYSKIFDKTHKEVTGFRFVDSTLYFITPDGLYSCDSHGNYLSKLLDQQSDQYLTGNSTHLYWVFPDHSLYKYMIYKYDIQADSVAAAFDLFPGNQIHISGIAADETKLYLLFQTLNYPATNFLIISDLDGNLISTIQLDRDIWGLRYCGILNNTLYLGDYIGETFSKLDLSTFAFSGGNPLPSTSQAAFQFRNGQFYFLDEQRLFMGRLPTDEVR